MVLNHINVTIDKVFWPGLSILPTLGVIKQIFWGPNGDYWQWQFQLNLLIYGSVLWWNATRFLLLNILTLGLAGLQLPQIWLYCLQSGLNIRPTIPHVKPAIMYLRCRVHFLYRLIFNIILMAMNGDSPLIWFIKLILDPSLSKGLKHILQVYEMHLLNQCGPMCNKISWRLYSNERLPKILLYLKTSLVNTKLLIQE